MKKPALVFLLAVLAAFSAGCTAMKPSPEPMMFQPATFEADRYAPKVANFQFILDASYSMGEEGRRDFLSARNVIDGINRTLPEKLGFTGGLRTFGHHPAQSPSATELVYGMTDYRTQGLAQALGRVTRTGGNSPLPQAIEAAGGDLAELQGRSALVIVSDGQKELEMDGAAEAAARLKEKMGDRVCIYTISVGGDPAGEALLQKVANAAGCGSPVTAASLASSKSMGSFVERVFLRAKGKKEPAPPRDSDGDGVVDARDKCPDTPKGQIVDDDGCTLKLTLHINFDFDKAEIKPQFEPDLKRAAEFIQKYRKAPYILIAGHTDSVGEAPYNQELSERRAKAVRQYLIDNYDIDPQRLIARGRGESQPVADNSTEAGRAENRRVEIICCAIIPPN